jgi:hypothetical protein
VRDPRGQSLELDPDLALVLDTSLYTPPSVYEYTPVEAAGF